MSCLPLRSSLPINDATKIVLYNTNTNNKNKQQQSRQFIYSAFIEITYYKYAHMITNTCVCMYVY